MFPGEIASRAMVDLHFSARRMKNSLKPNRFFPAGAKNKPRLRVKPWYSCTRLGTSLSIFRPVSLSCDESGLHPGQTPHYFCVFAALASSCPRSCPASPLPLIQCSSRAAAEERNFCCVCACVRSVYQDDTSAGSSRLC